MSIENRKIPWLLHHQRSSLLCNQSVQHHFPIQHLNRITFYLRLDNIYLKAPLSNRRWHQSKPIDWIQHVLKVTSFA